nr:hypothetical protein [Pseudoxanthomonas composti]
MAGQCARVAQRDPARQPAVDGSAHRGRGPQAAGRTQRPAPGDRARAGQGADRVGPGARRRGDRPSRDRTGPEPPGALPSHGPPRHSARMSLPPRSRQA